MTTSSRPGESWDALRQAAERGDLHTLRICFADHYGLLRGKRVPASHAVLDTRKLYGFCSAALAWDPHTIVYDGVPFAGFDNGYPDFYWRLDPDTAATCGWASGEALALGHLLHSDGSPVREDSRWALRRLFADGLLGSEPALRIALRFRRVNGCSRWQPGWPDPLASGTVTGLESSGYHVLAFETQDDRGGYRLTLEDGSALSVCDASVVARSAVIEISRAIAGGRPEPGPLVDFEASGIEVAIRPETGPIELDTVRRRLGDLMLLLRPTDDAYHAGVEQPGGPWLATSADGWLRCVTPSANANPYLVVAALIAATHADSESQGPSGPPTSLVDATQRFDAAWAHEWFEPAFREHALAIARCEARRPNPVSPSKKVRP